MRPTSPAQKRKCQRCLIVLIDTVGTNFCIRIGLSLVVGVSGMERRDLRVERVVSMGVGIENC